MLNLLSRDSHPSKRHPESFLSQLYQKVSRFARLLPGLGISNGREVVQRSSRAVATDFDRFHEVAGKGGDWAKTVYGDYYAVSVPVYSAIKMRADALTRAPLVAYRRMPDGGRLPVGPSHPAQQLLDRANPWYTQGDLWRATETYLNLWGSAFWTLEKDERGRPELWPIRPDRVRILPDKERHIKGFLYMGINGPVAYTPEEVVWIRYFNPLEEYAGLSPIAPLRLSADMGMDALKYNRNFFKNSALPDVIFTTEETMTDAEVEDFYQRWESRYKGPSQAPRPAIASFIKDIKTLGFSHREMEFVQGLRWSLEEVSRALGVPVPLLSNLERATFSNIKTAEELFWRNTMIPEMRFLEEQLNEMLMPRLGYSDLTVEFDLSSIEVLREEENSRVAREAQMLDRGVLTINEVRRERNLPEVPWGDTWWAPTKRTPAGSANPTPAPSANGSRGVD